METLSLYDTAIRHSPIKTKTESTNPKLHVERCLPMGSIACNADSKTGANRFPRRNKTAKNTIIATRPFSAPNFNWIGSINDCMVNTAGIEDDALLIEPEAFEPIQKLKTKYLGSINPRLHTNEVLIALSLSAQSNPMAKKAMEQLKNLKGSQAHITCDVVEADAGVYASLGIQITYEAEKH